MNDKYMTDPFPYQHISPYAKNRMPHPEQGKYDDEPTFLDDSLNMSFLFSPRANNTEKYQRKYFHTLGKHIVDWIARNERRKLTKYWKQWRSTSTTRLFDDLCGTFFARYAFKTWKRQVEVSKKRFPTTIRALLNDDVVYLRSSKNTNKSINNIVQKESPKKRQSIGTRTVRGVKLMYTQHFFSSLLGQELVEESQAKQQMAYGQYHSSLLRRHFLPWATRAKTIYHAKSVYRHWTRRLMRKCLNTWEQKTISSLSAKREAGERIHVGQSSRHNADAVFAFAQRIQRNKLEQSFQSWLTVWEFLDSIKRARNGLPPREIISNEAEDKQDDSNIPFYLYDPHGKWFSSDDEEVEKPKKKFLGYLPSDDDDDEDDKEEEMTSFRRFLSARKQSSSSSDDDDDDDGDNNNSEENVWSDIEGVGEDEIAAVMAELNAARAKEHAALLAKLNPQQIHAEVHSFAAFSRKKTEKEDDLDRELGAKSTVDFSTSRGIHNPFETDATHDDNDGIPSIALPAGMFHSSPAKKKLTHHGLSFATPHILDDSD